MPVDVNSSKYIDSSKENNDKDNKSKIDDIFVKGHVPNWQEEVFVIKKVKSTVSWIYVISDLNGEEIIRTLYKKELQKTNKKELKK